MKWSLARRLLVIAGVIYAVSLIPSSIKPAWTASPIRRSDQTVTITSTEDLNHARETACQAPLLLRPFMGSAKHVTIIFALDGQAQTVETLACP